MGARFQLVKVPAGLGDANDRHIEVATFDHRLQRREDFLVRQVPGRAEENQSIGLDITHGVASLPCRFFQVSAELITHSRQKFVCEVGFAARAKALVQCGGKDRTRHSLVDRRLDGPTALA